MKKNISFITLAFAFLAMSCDVKSSQINDENAQNEKKIVPFFDFSGGYLPPEGAKVTNFCDMYLSADAFVLGTIQTAEMTENPFVAFDSTTWTVVSETDSNACTGFDPALKIDIKIDQIISNYGLNLPEKISLYIGIKRFSAMQPEPIPDLELLEKGTFLKTPHIVWSGSDCETGQGCSFFPDQQIGFFANFDSENNILYLTEFAFWSESASYSASLKGDSVSSIQFEQLYNKETFSQIEDATVGCGGYESDYIRNHRNSPEVRREIINELVLPKCFVK